MAPRRAGGRRNGLDRACEPGRARVCAAAGGSDALSKGVVDEERGKGGKGGRAEEDERSEGGGYEEGEAMAQRPAREEMEAMDGVKGGGAGYDARS